MTKPPTATEAERAAEAYVPAGLNGRSMVDTIRHESFLAGVEWARANENAEVLAAAAAAAKVYAALEKSCTEIAGEPFHGDLATKALAAYQAKREGGIE